MSDIVIFDQNDNHVKDYIQYVNTPDYQGRSDVLINPNLSDLLTRGVPVRYWKQANGSIVEMSSAEKSAIDAAIAAGDIAAAEVQAKTSFDGTGSLALALKAFANEDLTDHNRIKDAFNALLTWLGSQATLTNRTQLTPLLQTEFTLAQLKAAIKADIDSGNLNNV